MNGYHLYNKAELVHIFKQNFYNPSLLIQQNVRQIYVPPCIIII